MPELTLTAQLCASIDGLTAQLQREEQQRQRAAQCIRQIPLAPPLMILDAGAGVIDYPDVLAAKTGFIWSVRRLTVFGFTAGTAVAYMNSQFGEPVAPFAVAGSATFGRGELLMHPGDRLVITASGITGNVQVIGAADCFEQWYLPNYIG